MKLSLDAIEDLYNIVTALEWEAFEEADGGALQICPICGHYKAEGHAADCALDQALCRADSGRAISPRSVA